MFHRCSLYYRSRSVYLFERYVRHSQRLNRIKLKIYTPNRLFIEKILLLLIQTFTISLGLWMMGSFVSRTLVMAFGYVYPAYECYKIVEKSQLEILQLLFWCHYWIIVALLTVFERVGDPLISWLPLYNEAKLAFFIYLWHPKTKGAACVFGFFLRPFIEKHEEEIDRYLFKLRLRMADIAVLFWHKTTSCGQTSLLDLLHHVSSLPAAESRRGQDHKDETDVAVGQSGTGNKHQAMARELEAKATEHISTMANGNPDYSKKESLDQQAPKLKHRKWRFSNLFRTK